MGNFNKRSGGGAKPFRKPSFGGGRGGFGGGRPSFDGGERTMYPTTCSECNKPCEVPFRPTGAKPIFCNNCFDRSSDNSGRQSYSKPSYAPREREQRAPSFAPPAPRSESYDDLKKELAIIHDKVERILKLVSPSAVIESVVTEDQEAIKFAPKKRAKKA